MKHIFPASLIALTLVAISYYFDQGGFGVLMSPGYLVLLLIQGIHDYSAWKVFALSFVFYSVIFYFIIRLTFQFIKTMKNENGGVA